jgi:hypothetical protein
MNDTNGALAGRKNLAVYAVVERKEGMRPYWLKIGAAFTNRDGSLTLVLDAFPSSTNRLQVREPKVFEEGKNGSPRPVEEEVHP